MSNILEIRDISKQYRLGLISTGTLSHDLNRWWHRMLGKEDPYLKIGETNDRTSKGASDYVWALKDISFDVKQGEVLGIIGRNGAGKSTLLKILSRVTGPTTGSIKSRGRIASLLEVGTGFHPELTGRENIFLNGAILGMTKQEIRKKFDEIVAFAGCERYIETPVKRYSSGMYVRLAFAVAAHLEPEILVVDEVLAVGDAEFQKKAIGKMKSVSEGEGRTVLFVSHNMSAVQNLCTKGIILKNGNLIFNGETHEAISNYLQQYISEKKKVEYDYNKAPGNKHIKLLYAEASANKSPFKTDDEIKITFILHLSQTEKGVYDFTFHLRDEMNNLVFPATTVFENETVISEDGQHRVQFTIPPNLLNNGTYTIEKFIVLKNKGTVLHIFNNVICFEVLPKERNHLGIHSSKTGIVRPDIKWDLIQP